MADVSQIKLPNGSVYDLIDEKSGYITAEYIEDKTDYEIPVSRVGEIEVGETAIGTDSTNFPTSKAVVDYVDERVVQEIEAINVPTKTSDLTNDSGFISSYTETDPVFSVSVAAGITSTDISNWNNKTSNTGTITSVRTTAGAHTTINVSSGAANFNVPTNTSHLTNDSGFLTLSTLPIYDGTVV